MEKRNSSSGSTIRAAGALFVSLSLAALAGCSRAEGDHVQHPAPAQAPERAATPTPPWGGSVPDESDSAPGPRDDLGRATGPTTLQVTFEQVKVKGGGISEADIQSVFAQNRDKLQACYDRTGDKGLSGQMILGFEIGEGGEVTDVSPLGESVPSATLVACALQSLSDMRFPAPKAGKAKVTYTVSFQPSSSTPPAAGPR